MARSETDRAIERELRRLRLERYGIVWRHGDPFRYRTWLGLRLLNQDAARLYFRTTV